MYAVKVKGRVPEDVEAELRSRGIKYQPSNQTDQDQFTVTHTPRFTPSSSFPLQSD
ncbi:hypothetical protein BKA82DRAFT_825337 [Pisolithus tinctorius]|uniref:Uncharacterized protein n=1 Tax=Pisolithus tinctorius Marx 270 TaxID=870435 RepID=A0A0C3IPM0_PISTI|nr:hypothetical protein BKA82DRAFT_825337 [Pisolithus tinctorius]KIN98862.1 hypothetical protein M404DRAFT_825337 [Pisolithus tinctorius Marx 270]